MVVNCEAVKVGDLEKNMESRKVAKPNLTTDFPDAVAPEGADQLTLRAEEGTIWVKMTTDFSVACLTFRMK